MSDRVSSFQEVATEADRLDVIDSRHRNNNKQERYATPLIHTFTQPTAIDDGGIRPMDLNTITGTQAPRLSKLTDQEREILRKKGACFRCRQTGHMSGQCPLRNLRQGNAEST